MKIDLNTRTYVWELGQELMKDNPRIEHDVRNITGCVQNECDLTNKDINFVILSIARCFLEKQSKLAKDDLDSLCRIANPILNVYEGGSKLELIHENDMLFLMVSKSPETCDRLTMKDVENKLSKYFP